MRQQLVVLILAAYVLPLAAQTFDVASVKPNKSSDQATSNIPLGPGDAYVPNGGYFSATNYPLITYLAFAWKVMGNQIPSLLPQLPGWVSSERFDIQARVDGNPTKDQMRLMMRSLLADRFKLAIHNETRQLNVIALVPVKAGKFGPQFQPHPEDSDCPTNPVGAAAPSSSGFPAVCGGLFMLPPSAPGRAREGARNVTMDFIANSLSGTGESGGAFVDRTGLTGRFDFVLEWTPEISNASPDQSGPSFNQALREQLGLKLESQKGSIEALVVDHVERLSDN